MSDPSRRSEQDDERWMRRALALAKRGAGRVSPNPLVGAVVVGSCGEQLGEGEHRAAGEAHAEVNAIRAAEEAHGAGVLTEATLYVTLEPCTHHGRTPPCTDLILEKGISRVVVGMADPHPAAAGGIRRLREAGVAVRTGVLGAACRRQNEAFAHHVRTGRPLVTLKQAQTLGGQVATATGDSRWITAKPARRRVHRWRNEADAVLVAAGTAAADDPRLTVRDPEPLDEEAPAADRTAAAHQPRRVVLDRTGRLSATLNLFSDAHAARTTAVVGEARSLPSYAEALRDAGGRLQRAPERAGHLDLNVLLERLGSPSEENVPLVQSLFVEAGPGLATALIRQDLVDRYFLFVAPKLLGTGTPAIGALGEEAAPHERIASARTFAEHSWETVGPDVLFKGFRREV
jgi:diaminohydroxyphosphoribosylaminopyrimidine deaminase/5-amino-6-(5-phosphoribosylamino)uracil reductase